MCVCAVTVSVSQPSSQPGRCSRSPGPQRTLGQVLCDRQPFCSAFCVSESADLPSSPGVTSTAFSLVLKTRVDRCTSSRQFLLSLSLSRLSFFPLSLVSLPSLSLLCLFLLSHLSLIPLSLLSLSLSVSLLSLSCLFLSVSPSSLSCLSFSLSLIPLSSNSP